MEADHKPGYHRGCGDKAGYDGDTAHPPPHRAEKFKPFNHPTTPNTQ